MHAGQLPLYMLLQTTRKTLFPVMQSIKSGRRQLNNRELLCTFADKDSIIGKFIQTTEHMNPYGRGGCLKNDMVKFISFIKTNP